MTEVPARSSADGLPLSFEEFMDQWPTVWQPRLFRYASDKLRAEKVPPGILEAWDVVQMTWEVLHRRQHDVCRPERFMIRVAENVIIQAARRSRTFGDDRLDNQVDDLPAGRSAEEVVLNHLTSENMRAALMTLSGRQLTVLYARFIDGRSHQETADICGTSTGSVCTHQSRACAKLRDDPRIRAAAKHTWVPAPPEPAPLEEKVSFAPPEPAWWELVARRAARIMRGHLVLAGAILAGVAAAVTITCLFLGVRVVVDAAVLGLLILLVGVVAVAVTAFLLVILLGAIWCLLGLAVYGAVACIRPAMDRLVGVPCIHLGGDLWSRWVGAWRRIRDFAGAAAVPMIGGAILTAVAAVVVVGWRYGIGSVLTWVGDVSIGFGTVMTDLVPTMLIIAVCGLAGLAVLALYLTGRFLVEEVCGLVASLGDLWRREMELAQHSATGPNDV